MSKSKVQRSKRWRYADRKAPVGAVKFSRCMAESVVVRGRVVVRDVRSHS